MTTDTDKRKGLILKEAREAKGISLNTVQDDTKIPLDVLKAIEEGYTVRAVTPFYFRAFMKKYAQYLHLDVSQIVEDYQPEKFPEPIKETSPQPSQLEVNVNNFFTQQRKQQLVKFAGLILVFLLVVKVVGGIVHKIANRPHKGAQVLKVNKSEQFTKVVKKENKNIKSNYTNSANSEKKEVPLAAPLKELQKESPKEPPKGSPEKVNVAPPPAPIHSPAVNKNTTLTVKAKKNCWLQVKTDGNIVFQSALKKGDVNTWTANEKIEVTGKDINSLEYEVNGQMIGVLGRADREARKLIVTKEGMAVKK